jgi:hypothetical protein
MSIGATVTLAHGGGGRAMKDLIAEVFVAAFDTRLWRRSKTRRGSILRHTVRGDQAELAGDKPVKYPHMFRAADLVIVNKVDLLPYLDFDAAGALVNPGAAVCAYRRAPAREWRNGMTGCGGSCTPRARRHSPAPQAEVGRH